jgi:hypothetical protein
MIDDHQAKSSKAIQALDDIEALSKNDKNSLQKNKRFQDNINNLHGEHLVIGWLDTPVAAREGIAYAKAQESSSGARAFEQFNQVGTQIGSAAATSKPTIKTVQLDPYSSLYGDTGGSGLLNQKQLDDAYSKIQTAADDAGSFSFELYATSDSFVVEGVTEKEPQTTNKGTEKKIFNSLPNDTLGAVTVSDFGKEIQDALTGYEKDATDPAFKKLQPSIDKLVGSIGNEGVGFIHNGDPVVGGAVVELNDPNAAQAAIDELINNVKSRKSVIVGDYPVPGGKAYTLQQKADPSNPFANAPDGIPNTPVFIGIANGRLSITNNGEQLKAALAGDGSLGDQASVKKAFSDQKIVFGSFYVNLDQVVQLAQKDGAKLSGDSGDWVKSLDVLGSQSWINDGHYHSELHLGLK